MQIRNKNEFRYVFDDEIAMTLPGDSRAEAKLDFNPILIIE